MSILKNGKTYMLEEDEYYWKIILKKSGSVIIFRFGKREFSDAEELTDYVKLCAEF